MSDAKGPGSEPRDGEPIEGDIARVPAPAEPDSHEPVVGDTGDIPTSRREARTNTGETEIVATPQDDAPIAKPAADEPVESTPAPPQREQPPHEEPDYAALAADLDDLESRGASTTVTTRSGAAERKPDPWFEPADKTQTFTASDAYDAPATSAVTASEPIAPETSAAAAPPAQQLPIFVQAPEPPRVRGNRAAAAGIGLVAALVFAILYFGAKLGFGALNGEVSFDNIADASLRAVTSLGFWTTVVVFFLGFWLLGALVNRARWAAWVLLGIFVAIIAYIGHILGALVDAPFWALTASQGFEEVGKQLLSPLAIAAFVLAREITIWFGAWAARRGARVTERNAEAQAEYERTLEAGPKLSA